MGHRLKITIEGGPETGKTEVAVLLEALLHQHAAAVVRVQDPGWVTRSAEELAERRDYPGEYLRHLEMVDILVRSPESPTEMDLPTRYVLYSPKCGIYLGSLLGLGLWSGIDPAGQDSAPTFASFDVAADFASKLGSIEDATPKPVQLYSTSGWATVRECEAAGLPRWDPDATPQEKE